MKNYRRKRNTVARLVISASAAWVAVILLSGCFAFWEPSSGTTEDTAEDWIYCSVWHEHAYMTWPSEWAVVDSVTCGGVRTEDHQLLHKVQVLVEGYQDLGISLMHVKTNGPNADLVVTIFRRAGEAPWYIWVREEP